MLPAALFGAGATFAAWGYPAIKFHIEERLMAYGSFTTAEQVADLSTDLKGKMALVTGCNTGIGLETVRWLFASGVTVVMACRNEKKATAARQTVVDQFRNKDASKLIVMKLDLNDLNSVETFAKEFTESKMSEQLDYLVCNAGVMAFPKLVENKHGMERQFGVNHLAHFYLFQLLLPVVLKSKTRVVTVSSIGTNFTTPKMMNQWLDAGGVKGPRPDVLPYNDWHYYGISKLCNALFAREITRRYLKDGVVGLSLHPGFVNTDLSRNLEINWEGLKLAVPNLPYSKGIPRGASTTMRAITIPTEKLFKNDADESKPENMSFFLEDCRPFNDKSFNPEFRFWQNTDIDQKLWDYSLRAIDAWKASKSEPTDA